MSRASVKKRQKVTNKWQTSEKTYKIIIKCHKLE